MSPELMDLIRYRAQRAKTALGEARLLFENSYTCAALNRCYYAAFYAATAFLLTKNKSSSKHAGILALFKAQAAKSGLIPAESVRFYMELYKYRLKIDYEDYAELKALEVLSWLDKTSQFVKQIDSVIEQIIA